MAFDPTQPAENSPLSSEVMRNQLNGLNELINDANANSAKNVDGVAELFDEISDPPTQVQVIAIVQKLNELIIGLHRS